MRFDFEIVIDWLVVCPVCLILWISCTDAAVVSLPCECLFNIYFLIKFFLGCVTSLVNDIFFCSQAQLKLLLVQNYVILLLPFSYIQVLNFWL